MQQSKRKYLKTKPTCIKLVKYNTGSVFFCHGDLQTKTLICGMGKYRKSELRCILGRNLTEKPNQFV